MQSLFSLTLDGEKNFIVLKYEVYFMMCCIGLEIRGFSCAHKP